MFLFEQYASEFLSLVRDRAGLCCNLIIQREKIRFFSFTLIYIFYGKNHTYFVCFDLSLSITKSVICHFKMSTKITPNLSSSNLLSFLHKIRGICLKFSNRNNKILPSNPGSINKLWRKTKQCNLILNTVFFPSSLPYFNFQSVCVQNKLPKLSHKF